MTPIERAALELHAGGCADDECDGSDLGGWDADARAALVAALDVEELARVLNRQVVRLVIAGHVEMHDYMGGIEFERALATAIREHLLSEGPS